MYHANSARHLTLSTSISFDGNFSLFSSLSANVNMLSWQRSTSDNIYGCHYDWLKYRHIRTMKTKTETKIETVLNGPLRPLSVTWLHNILANVMFVFFFRWNQIGKIYYAFHFRTDASASSKCAFDQFPFAFYTNSQFYVIPLSCRL